MPCSARQLLLVSTQSDIFAFLSGTCSRGVTYFLVSAGVASLHIEMPSERGRIDTEWDGL